jgi:hypothetical protein
VPWPTADAAVSAVRDAATPPDAPSPPPTMPYEEQHDSSNDYDHGGLEVTGRTFDGTQSLMISGFINTGPAHYDAAYGTIDVDNFTITVAADANMLVTPVGSDLSTIPSVTVEIYSDELESVVGSAAWPSDIEQSLPAGGYEIGIAAFGSAASPIIAGSPIPYTIIVQPFSLLD